MFFTERNMVLITFDATKAAQSPQQTPVSSVIRRMGKLFAKSVLPVSIGVVAFSDTDLNQSSLENFYNSIITELKKTQNEIRGLIQSYQK